MRAHQLDENGLIVNTIEVDSIDVFPNLVIADNNGERGDSVIDGILAKKPEKDISAQEKNEEILFMIRDIEAKKQPRAERDAILSGDKIRLQQIENEIFLLRSKLIK